MTYSLDDHIEDYLNGNLSEENTKRFEEDLLKEDVANEFREVLFMRELLRDIPPDGAPSELIEKIEKSLLLEKRKKIDETEYEEKAGFGRILNAFKLSFSWPKYALAGISGSTGVMKDSLSGFNTVAYSLGPLREPARKGIKSIRFPKKPLWKITLSKLW
jgi:hypothetical protein